MITKDSYELTLTRHLQVLLDRPQSLPGSWPSGRIEMVGTRLGRVAAGVFPNGSLRTVGIVVVGGEGAELTTHLTFVNEHGGPLDKPDFYSSHAFIDSKRIKEPGGLLEESPFSNSGRRIEIINMGDTLLRIASSGSAYDPFQIKGLRPYLISAIDSAPISCMPHPAVLEAVQSIRPRS